MNNVMDFKRAPKDERTVMDTWVLTSESIEAWRIPPFQRPLRVNDKVRQIGEEIKTTEVIPGVITLGIVDTGRDRSTYLMDGQHRIEGFRISGLKEAFADMRILHFSNMADMGVAFVNLNSQIVKMRPDDILRGMEGHIEGVRIVRERCNFVGYDQVRRGTHSPILGVVACHQIRVHLVQAALPCARDVAAGAPDLGVEARAHLVDALLDLGGARGLRLDEGPEARGYL